MYGRRVNEPSVLSHFRSGTSLPQTSRLEKMMKINELILTINNFDNDSMAENASGELSRIFRGLADRLDNGNGVVSNLDGLRLMDINGNQVGDIDLDWEQGPDIPNDCDEVIGLYGSGHTDCTVFVHVDSGWYCVEGSCNVNQTDSPDLLVDGVDVEELSDVDCFTAGEINTLEEFAYAIADMI